jgi:hypothetical protein
MSHVRWVGCCLACVALCVVGLLTSTCSPAKPASPISAPMPSGPLWGDLTPVVSVKELMRDMIDPLSDNIFRSVSIVVTDAGIVETAPTTEEDWDKIRIGAVTLAEGAYLLKVPRPFAPPGDENNSFGDDPPELSPAAILAKVQHDPVLWNAKIEALRNVARAVLEIVKKRDAPALWDAGEDLDNACEGCHLEFWYPGQKELMRKLGRSLRMTDADRPMTPRQ